MSILKFIAETFVRPARESLVSSRHKRPKVDGLSLRVSNSGDLSLNVSKARVSRRVTASEVKALAESKGVLVSEVEAAVVKRGLVIWGE